MIRSLGSLKGIGQVWSLGVTTCPDWIQTCGQNSWDEGLEGSICVVCVECGDVVVRSVLKGEASASCGRLWLYWRCVWRPRAAKGVQYVEVCVRLGIRTVVGKAYGTIELPGIKMGPEESNRVQ